MTDEQLQAILDTMAAMATQRRHFIAVTDHASNNETLINVDKVSCVYADPESGTWITHSGEEAIRTKEDYETIFRYITDQP